MEIPLSPTQWVKSVSVFTHWGEINNCELTGLLILPDFESLGPLLPLCSPLDVLPCSGGGGNSFQDGSPLFPAPWGSTQAGGRHRMRFSSSHLSSIYFLGMEADILPQTCIQNLSCLPEASAILLFLQGKIFLITLKGKLPLGGFLLTRVSKKSVYFGNIHPKSPC